LRKRFPGVTKGIDDDVLMALQHLSGLGDARIYLDTLERTKSYEAAQEALNQSIEKRTGEAPPTNKTVFEYLNNFSENLEKENTTKEPQVMAPKKEPVINPNPTFSASPFAAPKVTETKPQAKPKTIQVEPKVEPQSQQSSFLNNKTSDIPKVTLPDIDFNLKTSASITKWVFEAFGGSDEDVMNVLNYLENGGTFGDAWTMAQNFWAKKLGSEYTDLIGDAGSLPSMDANTAIANWGTQGLLPPKKESSVKTKYLIDEMQVSSQPAVNQNNWTSNSFALNLKSKDTKFGVLDNIHSGSNVGNINTFYNNFTPVKGKILYTAQNDITDGRKIMPLKKINEGDDWYKGYSYLMKLNNNKLEVVKGSDIETGDNIVQTGFKIFSMDDLDIKDGKINTVYNNGIGALIPKFKKSPEQNSKNHNHSYGDSFVIGLTDKTKTPGYIPLENATQYGKSRGGSFVIFSEDLSQQYMVGGSFKNLYDFHNNLKKQYPDKEFKIFTSDTGTYSNSVIPKSGIIDGTVYRDSNNRNSWGAVQHLILLD
jgi:hypothetical protein